MDPNLAATYTLIYSFLTKRSQSKVAQALKKAVKDIVVLRDDITIEGPQLDEIIQEWKTLKARKQLETTQSDSSEDSSSDSNSDISSSTSSSSGGNPNSGSDSDSDSNSDSDSSSPAPSASPSITVEATSKPATEVPSSAKPNGKPIIGVVFESDSSSSSKGDTSSESDDELSEGEKPKTKRPQLKSSAPESRKSSVTLSSNASPKIQPKREDANSSNLSSSSDSDSDSSNSDSDEPQQECQVFTAKAATPKTIKKKISSSSSSSDSSDSDSSSSDQEAKPPTTVKTSRGIKQIEVNPAPTKKRRTTESGESVVTATTHIDPKGSIQPSGFNKQNKEKNERKINVPFRRVDPETVKNNIVMDNRYEAKTGPSNDYGQRAHNDLIVTRGAGFRKEKNKKKRGSYHGGEITLNSHSFKFKFDP